MIKQFKPCDNDSINKQQELEKRICYHLLLDAYRFLYQE